MVQRGNRVCKGHGAVVPQKRCSHEGCANHAKRGGLCYGHGKHLGTRKSIRCSHDGCTRQSQRGGVCQKHRAKSLVAASGEVKLPPPPPEGSEDTAAVAVAGGEMEIEVHYPSDDEEMGAWIWKSSCMARLGTVNGVEGTTSP